MLAVEVQQLIAPAVPKHLCIIMDGNRRWAKERGLPAIMGHRAGANTLTRIVKAARDWGITVLTVYAFSTENWSRASQEVESLLRLIEFYLLKQCKEMVREGVRLCTIGDLSRFPLRLQKTIEKVKEKTAGGSKIQLVLALNYGGRDEITRAVRAIVETGMTAQEITENTITTHLDTKELQDPDLFIRTSGEMRLSNFLLWQLSYAEVYVTDVLWPDFSEECLAQAIEEYQRRDKRFGS